MAPSSGTTSTPLKLVVTFPPNHSTLQWHPTMAPSSGTTSTAPCNGTLVPRPIRQSGSSPSPLIPCNGTLVPRPIRQSGSSPSPLIGSKNPYSYRYLGKKWATNQIHLFTRFLSFRDIFTKNIMSCHLFYSRGEFFLWWKNSTQIIESAPWEREVLDLPAIATLNVPNLWNPRPQEPQEDGRWSSSQ